MFPVHLSILWGNYYDIKLYSPMFEETCDFFNLFVFCLLVLLFLHLFFPIFWEGGDEGGG